RTSKSSSSPTGQKRIVSLYLFHDTPPPQIFTLSLHDALPISCNASLSRRHQPFKPAGDPGGEPHGHDDAHDLEAGDQRGVEAEEDRKSTRLNSSHSQISYAVFCLKKKTPSMLNTMSSPVPTAF